MRGRGENSAPHFFCTRQASPRLVGQFFWTIVQIFCRRRAGVVRLILKIEAQGAGELVAGGVSAPSCVTVNSVRQISCPRKRSQTDSMA